MLSKKALILDGLLVGWEINFENIFIKGFMDRNCQKLYKYYFW